MLSVEKTKLFHDNHRYQPPEFDDFDANKRFHISKGLVERIKDMILNQENDHSRMKPVDLL
ncbi:hypothetical protein AV942_21150 (plasmid) [Alteromonas mediterranea]|uniref:Uncharacterized protein n=1 Tax=Alteromonas mediterranea TaxID=314275 RepID=A0AAC9F7T6_9ALTE|nr:hypothetical protein AV942_21150 [Alteromonas mediterranea]AMJ85050.1 hypothetical protein AV941_21265 [Alteromonas mediterranea]